MNRQEAIEVISQDIPCEYDTDLIEALNMAIEALKTERIAIEALKSERLEGEWIEYIDDMNGARYGKCTSCNKDTLNAVSYDLEGGRHIMDFCPKCGADMRGDK